MKKRILTLMLICSLPLIAGLPVQQLREITIPSVEQEIAMLEESDTENESEDEDLAPELELRAAYLAAYIADLEENRACIGCDLEGADLVEMQLQGVNFSHATLRNANLQRANLQNANLSYADLRNANLAGANLRGANLDSARLWGASLFHTDLTGVDITGILDYRDVDFSDAIGTPMHQELLDDALHHMD